VQEAVRPARADDVPRLAELVAAAVAELAPMKGGAVWRAREAPTEPFDRRLDDAIDDPDAHIVAGTIDDVVIGYGLARVEELRDGTRLGVVDDLFVEEGARAVGVGEAIMGALVTWCRDRGCRGIDAMALPGHRAAKNFFEESGFIARKIVMHRPLDEE